MLINNAVITGSFIVNGVDVTGITGSSAISSSFLALSSSYLATSASYVITSGSYVITSASYAQSSASLSIRTSNLEATSSTLVSASSSFAASSASVSVRVTNLEATSSVVSSSFATTSGSLSTRVTNLESTSSVVSSSFATTSGSISGRVTLIEGQYATTGSNTFTGPQYVNQASNAIGFTSTASLYTDGGLRVTKDSFVSGTAYFNNVVVYGTSSIQYITSSQLNIGTNIITVNTDTPAVRFGGLAVFDSGSTGLTGSMLWDSQANHWVYSNPSGSTYSGGMLISGPRAASLGTEVGTTSCALMMGQGGDHITSSAILHYSNATCFYGTTTIGSGGTVCTTMTNASCVGIGTTSPSDLLDIYASSGTAAIRLSGAGAGTNTYRITGQLIGVSNTGFGIYDSTNSTYRLAIDGSGNVGIGTSSPTELLSVNSSSNVAVRVENTSTGTARFQLVNNDGSTNNNNWSILAGFGNTRNLSFRDNLGGERMRIDALGNVGIGVTPSAWETTWKVIQLAGGSVYVNAGGTTGQIGLAQNWFYDGSQNRYLNSAAASDYYQFGGAHIWRIAPSGTAGCAITFCQAMTLNASGNLSIGNTNDTYKLDVTGTGRFSGSITSLINIAGIQNQLILENLNTTEGADGNSIYFKGYQGSLAKISAYGIPTQQVGGYLQLQSYSDNTTANIGLIIHQGGNVSINNTNNSFQLDVSGTLRVTGAATFSSSVTAGGTISNNSSQNFIYASYDDVAALFQRVGTYGAVIRLGRTGVSNSTTIDYPADGTFAVSTAGSERMRITSAGIACFASTVCTPSLVACVTSAAAITIDGYSKLSFKDRGTEYGTINASRYNFGGESTLFTFQSGNCFLFLNGTNCLMFIGSNGNVGINTSSPTVKLSVNSGINTSTATVMTLQQATNGAVKDAAGFGLAINNGGEATNAAELIISTASGGSLGERMRITSGGDVYIGNSTISVLQSAIFLQKSGIITTVRAYSSGTINLVEFYRQNAGDIGSITYNGTNTLYGGTSDYRLKEDLQDYNGLDIIGKLKTYDFKWKNTDVRDYGMMAHELQEILPNYVSGEKDAIREDGSIKSQMVDYSKLVPVLIKSIQEQQCIICSQAGRIRVLESCLGIS